MSKPPGLPAQRHSGRRWTHSTVSRLGPRSRYALAATAGQFAFAAVAFIGSVLAARLLGPEGKGEYTAWTLGTVTAALALGGSVAVGLGRAYLHGALSAFLCESETRGGLLGGDRGGARTARCSRRGAGRPHHLRNRGGSGNGGLPQYPECPSSGETGLELSAGPLDWRRDLLRRPRRGGRGGHESRARSGSRALGSRSICVHGCRDGVLPSFLWHVGQHVPSGAPAAWSGRIRHPPL